MMSPLVHTTIVCLGRDGPSADMPFSFRLDQVESALMDCDKTTRLRTMSGDDVLVWMPYQLFMQQWKAYLEEQQ